jgi:hypothetical protein
VVVNINAPTALVVDRKGVQAAIDQAAPMIRRALNKMESGVG